MAGVRAVFKRGRNVESGDGGEATGFPLSPE
jgi:hypothetical protein